MTIEKRHKSEMEGEHKISLARNKKKDCKQVNGSRKEKINILGMGNTEKCVANVISTTGKEAHLHFEQGQPSSYNHVNSMWEKWAYF